jgi:indolepyruvate ferredoxin oxidoreductase beta subunit
MPRTAFETAIRNAGLGVEASLKAFTAGVAAASSKEILPLPLREGVGGRGSRAQDLDTTQPRTDEELQTNPIIAEGIRRLTDYQDPAYADLYQTRLQSLSLSGELLTETARHLALWMSYEDTIRVADLKTRATRFARVRAEVRVKPNQLLRITEFMHPRVQEIADTLPAPVGRWLLRSDIPRRLVACLTRHGRHIETTSITGFLLLRAVAALRRFRRHTLRYAVEQTRIEQWLARIGALASRDPALALEVARCQRLVKGYGDTHERGWANFQRLMQAADHLNETPAAAARLAALHTAALADDTGQALTKALEAA